MRVKAYINKAMALLFSLLIMAATTSALLHHHVEGTEMVCMCLTPQQHCHDHHSHDHHSHQCTVPLVLSAIEVAHEHHYDPCHCHCPHCAPSAAALPPSIAIWTPAGEDAPRARYAEMPPPDPGAAGGGLRAPPMKSVV